MEKTHSRDLEKQNERLQKVYDTLSKQYSDLTSSMQQMQQRYVCVYISFALTVHS